MAVTAYAGVPGSGKSYAMLAEVIVPAVRAGRRVLTNVSGTNPDAVIDYCAKKWPNDVGHFGSVVLIDGEKTTEPGFFPSTDAPEGESVLQPGDLFVFDEVRMYWPRRGRFSEEIMKFLRYHRHFVDSDTGQSTDVVLASQLITDYHADYRGIIERNYKFKKLKTLGRPTNYVWSMWEGSDQRKGEAVANGGGTYRKEIYALYSSYIAGSGKETGTDRRENVLANKKLWALCGGVLVMALISFWSLWSMFTPSKKPVAATNLVAPIAPVVQPMGTPDASVPTANGAPPVSSIWRIAGRIETPSLNVVVLVDRAGNSRFEDPSNFTMLDGRPYVGIVDGQRVLALGNAAPSSSAASIFGGVR
jgi:zona occludens toxin